MLAERHDWEMYAGLASGTMADLRLLPPYVRPFYEESTLGSLMTPRTCCTGAICSAGTAGRPA